jgi:hypothetical protein
MQTGSSELQTQTEAARFKLTMWLISEKIHHKKVVSSVPTFLLFARTNSPSGKWALEFRAGGGGGYVFCQVMFSRLVCSIIERYPYSLILKVLVLKWQKSFLLISRLESPFNLTLKNPFTELLSIKSPFNLISEPSLSNLIVFLTKSPQFNLRGLLL